MDSNLADLLVKVLKNCEAEGMVRPYIVCAISPNGTVFCSRVLANADTEVLVEHYEPGGFKLPMTVVVLDQENTAAKAIIQPGGAISYH